MENRITVKHNSQTLQLKRTETKLTYVIICNKKETKTNLEKKPEQKRNDENEHTF